ncbi:hypothetical protein OBE_03207, partial [human gut metagenome]
SFWQIRDLSGYESVYGVIMNGRNKYLNTSLGIVNEENATLLPVKHVKSISGALEKNPNEGFFILYYYGMSFKGLDDVGVPEPLFCDLAFSQALYCRQWTESGFGYVSQDYPFCMVNQACFLSR